MQVCRMRVSMKDSHVFLVVKLAYRTSAGGRTVETTYIELVNGVCTCVQLASPRALHADVFNALVGESERRSWPELDQVLG